VVLMKWVGLHVDTHARLACEVEMELCRRARLRPN
jgi:hypothetical protein